MKRIKKHMMKIDACPEVVFPLLSPVREAEWIDGWSCEMIHSESGLAEEGVQNQPRAGKRGLLDHDKMQLSARSRMCPFCHRENVCSIKFHSFKNRIRDSHGNDVYIYGSDRCGKCLCRCSGPAIQRIGAQPFESIVESLCQNR